VGAEARQVHTGRVLLAHERAAEGRFRLRDSDATSASLLVAIGSAFAVVGLADLALLWTPLRFGNPAWEFATLSQTFTNVPMAGLGLLLMAYGLVRHPHSSALSVRVAAVVFLLVAAILAALGMLYVTVAPEVLRQAAPETADAVGRTIIKNAVEVIAYPLVFAAIGVFLWRGVERVRP
jgi:hypothetical protein